jgi:hypothetical protein
MALSHLHETLMAGAYRAHPLLARIRGENTLPSDILTNDSLTAVSRASIPHNQSQLALYVDNTQISLRRYIELSRRLPREQRKFFSSILEINQIESAARRPDYVKCICCRSESGHVKRESQNWRLSPVGQF